jgi:hypothetical protein
MTVTLYQRPALKRAYKKLHDNQRDAVHAAMRAIIANPRLGEEKKGDLAGIWVHKFDCIHQLYLLAYQWDETTRTWLALGPHENFYRDLKRQEA